MGIICFGCEASDQEELPSGAQNSFVPTGGISGAQAGIPAEYQCEQEIQCDVWSRFGGRVDIDGRGKSFSSAISINHFCVDRPICADSRISLELNGPPSEPAEDNWMWEKDVMVACWDTEGFEYSMHFENTTTGNLSDTSFFSITSLSGDVTVEISPP